MFKSINPKKFDIVLLLEIIALNLIGIFAIGSAAPDLQLRQLGGAGVGLLLMFLFSLVNYRKVLRFGWYLYFFNLALLICVLIFGTNEGGAQRWISIGILSFQPSEIAKLLLILFFAKFIVTFRGKMPTLQYLAACLILIIIPVVLVMRQPDLSTSIVILMIFAVMIFVGGISWKVVATVLGITIPAFFILLRLITMEGSSILSEYQRDRIMAWLHPEQYAATTAYQTMNSIMAIGSGQIVGKGFHTNKFSSLLDAGFISESQTDFIFTVIGEEFGFIGSIITVGLLLLITIRLFRIAREVKVSSGRLIAAGMGAWIGFQGFLNIGVATGVMPNTGIPLPFVSYGLTSLICLYIGIGFVMNVRMETARNDTKKRPVRRGTASRRARAVRKDQ